MCSKGSGSPPVPGATSTAFQSATAANPNVAPMYQNFLANASNLSQTPFNPAMYGSVAPFSPEQTGAGTTLYSLGLQMPGYSNLVSTDAGGVQGAAGNVYNAAAPIGAIAGDVFNAGANLGTVGSTMGNFDPNAVQSMMSPYTQSVVQATQDWFNNQNAIQGNQLLGQAIQSGNAFGGDRAGVAEAQLAGQQQLAQAPVIAGLNQAGYTQALNEYNQLKQMGLMGAQAGLQGAQAGLGAFQAAQQADVTGLGAEQAAQQADVTGLQAQLASMSGPQAAMGWGTMEQQLAQQQANIAQQNAMMSSAYPFQLQNWYGSVLGGIGPLQGSFAQGYTTPPPPNATNQIIGGISALAGLGTSLFPSSPPTASKRGGTVRFAPRPMLRSGMRRGGIVIPLRFGGPALMHRFARGGYMLPPPPPRRQYGGLVPIRRFQTGGGLGDAMPGMDDDEGIGTLNIKSYNTPSNLDAGALLQRMESQAQRAQTAQQLASQNPNLDLASAIKGVGSVAKAAAPLFALLKSGGAVRYYQDGGNGDDDKRDDDSDSKSDQQRDQSPTRVTMLDDGTPLPSAAAQPPPAEAGLVPTPTPRPADADGRPPLMQPPGTYPDLQPGAPGSIPPGGIPFDPTAGGETPAGVPLPPTRPTMAAPPARGGTPSPFYGAGTPGGAQPVPGAPRGRSFSERLATNPLWNFGMGMLAHPGIGQGLRYMGPGIGAGMQAATNALQKQALLDKGPQTIDDGKRLSRRVGKHTIPTALPSPRARAQRTADATATPPVTSPATPPASPETPSVTPPETPPPTQVAGREPLPGTVPMAITGTSGPPPPTPPSEEETAVAAEPLGLGGSGQFDTDIRGIAPPQAWQHPEVLEGEKTGDANLIKAIAEGRKKALPLYGKNSADNRRIMGKVLEYDPGYDETYFARRQRTANEFAVGARFGSNIAAMNTVAQHMQTYKSYIDLLNRSRLVPWNTIKNEAARMGLTLNNEQDLLGQIDVARKGIADEAAKVFAGGGTAALEDRRTWYDQFDPSKPRETLDKSLTTLQEMIIKGRLGALSHQYNEGMRTSHRPMEFLTQDTRKIYDDLRRHGERAPTTPPAGGGGGGAQAPIRVQTIDEARKLPPGTRFIDPNGVERTR